MDMNILACIKKIYPDWRGSVWDNSYAGIRPHELETRTTPPIEELEAVWPEVRAEQLAIQREAAYLAEADPLYNAHLAMAARNHPDADAKKEELLAKIAEIQERYRVGV